MKVFQIFISVLLLSILSPKSIFPQNNTYVGVKTDSINQKKLNTFLISSTAIYGASLVGLNEIWYKDSPRESFHFFNDNREWKQLDKLGHFHNTYQISRFGVYAFNRLGLSRKKSYLWGSLLGVLVLSPIEILDGFSSEFGASWGDIIANASGAGLVYGQYALWNELRIHPKYSFTPTSYANQRPETLGDGFHEEIIKDYNGMTFWLSFDIYSFLKPGSNFPKWLNIAVGYGADDMIYANDESNVANGFDPHRQYYFTIDIDLTYIRSKSKVVNTLLYLVNIVHLPSPALEYNRKEGLVFHAIHF